MITMNSSFALQDDHTGDTLCYTLVYPEEEAPHAGNVSVLSPMGMVLYGAESRRRSLLDVSRRPTCRDGEEVVVSA